MQAAPALLCLTEEVLIQEGRVGGGGGGVYIQEEGSTLSVFYSSNVRGDKETEWQQILGGVLLDC